MFLEIDKIAITNGISIFNAKYYLKNTAQTIDREKIFTLLQLRADCPHFSRQA